MKPLHGAELRHPHKDRSHIDYKHSVMLLTGEVRKRPVRRRVGELVVHARMPDGTFQDCRTWTSKEQADGHKAARHDKNRRERRAARDAALAIAGRKLASGVCCGDFNAVPTAPAIRRAELC